MRIAITGSTGLVGRALTSELERAGATVVRLLRGKSWDVELSQPLDAVIHLAGEAIAARRWTANQKARIRDSRVQGTEALVQQLLRQPTLPKTFISASAVGFYGDRGSGWMTETSDAGTGFLPEVCEAWESTSRPLQAIGVRVVHLRIGIVLSRDGGALPVMRRPFLWGVGGPLGTGQQFMSWVTLTDLVSIFHQAIVDPTLRGPVNAVSPHPVTNEEFSRTLARVMHRPCLFRLPAWAARLALGEMADALLLSSIRVRPAVLESRAFPFQYPDLEPALRHALGVTTS